MSEPTKTTRDGREVDVVRIMAGEMYQTDEVDVPADAKVYWAEGGAWVQAYVWVSDEDRLPANRLGDA